MATLLDFAAQLLGSLVRLVVIFVTEVALRDPLAFVAFLFGAAFVSLSVGFFAYLGLGALLDEFGVAMRSPGRTPRRRG
jgi:hypothetical protein